ncbi:MAG: hypothetical protein HY291_06220 [Planctomycetes bacterium]|nr:hypothetical protein [Planctomycetota bacterium]
MSTRDPNLALPEEFARAAELHLRCKMGEDLSAAELTELDQAKSDAATAEFLNGLDDTDEVLTAAMKKARPAADFSKKVMAQVSKPAGSAKIFAASGLFASMGRKVLIGVGVAAAVALAALAALQGLKATPGEAPKVARTDGATGPKVAKGSLKDAAGREVQNVAAGQRYRTGEQEVVLQVGSQSMLKITPNTEFEALAAEAGEPQRNGLQLRNGSLYANEAGAEPLLVRAPAFDAEVKRGVAWVHQEGSEGEHAGAPGIVLVFKGSARVRLTAEGETVTLGEGELYVAGGTVQPVGAFLEEAPRRAADLEKAPPLDETAKEKRARYHKVVEGYRSDLHSLDDEIAHTTDAARLAEMKTRRDRVRALLEQHRHKLDGMATTEEDAPAKARSLRRSIENVRKGQDGFKDPSTWM